MIRLTDTYVPGTDTAFETVEEQTVIINLNSGTYVSLNPTGTFLWQRLDGETTLAAIAAELADTYGVSADVTAGDVLALAGQLHEEGLIALAADQDGDGSGA